MRVFTLAGAEWKTKEKQHGKAMESQPYSVQHILSNFTVQDARSWKRAWPAPLTASTRPVRSATGPMEYDYCLRPEACLVKPAAANGQ